MGCWRKWTVAANSRLQITFSFIWVKCESEEWSWLEEAGALWSGLLLGFVKEK